jgi:hypothetical protein
MTPIVNTPAVSVSSSNSFAHSGLSIRAFLSVPTGVRGKLGAQARQNVKVAMSSGPLISRCWITALLPCSKDR